ncbi:MAG: DNA translocase FtsK 4TM domain-containing protein [Brevinema sp.]
MFKGIIRVIVSYVFILLSALLSISLVGFSFSDLMYLTTDFNPNPHNWLGEFGLNFGSPIALFYGYGGMIWAFYSFLTGVNLLFGITPLDLIKQFIVVHILAFLLSIACSLFANDPFMAGGILGSLAASKMLTLFPNTIWIPLLLGMFLIALSFISEIPLRVIDKSRGFFHPPQDHYPSAVSDGCIGQDTDYPMMDEREIMDIYSENTIDYQIPGSAQVHDPNLFRGQDEYVALEDQPETMSVPEFLKRSRQDEDWNESPMHLSSKRLTQSETPSFLKDVDFDLISPYREQKSTSFYEKVSEAQKLDDDIAELDGMNYAPYHHINTELPEPMVKSNVLKRLSFDLSEKIDRKDDVKEIVQETIAEASLEQEIVPEENIQEISIPEQEIETEETVSEISEHEAQITAQELPQEEVLDAIDKERIKAEIANLEDLEDPQAEQKSEEVAELSPEVIPVIQHSSKFPPVADADDEVGVILPKLVTDLASSPLKTDGVPLFLENSDLSDSERLLVEGLERTQAREKESQASIKEKLQSKQKQLAQSYYEEFGHLNFDAGDLSKEISNSQGVVLENIQTPTDEPLVEEVQLPEQSNMDSNVAFRYLQDEISELKKSTSAPKTIPSILEQNPFEDIFGNSKSASVSETNFPKTTDDLQKEMMIFEEEDHIVHPPVEEVKTPIKHISTQEIVPDPAPQTEVSMPTLNNFDEWDVAQESIKEESIFTNHEPKEIIAPQSIKIAEHSGFAEDAFADLVDDEPLTEVETPTATFAPSQNNTLIEDDDDVIAVPQNALDQRLQQEALLDDDDFEEYARVVSVTPVDVDLAQESPKPNTNIEDLSEDSSDDSLLAHDIGNEIFDTPALEELQQVELPYEDEPKVQIAQITDLDQQDASLMPSINTQGHLVNNPLEFLELEDDSFNQKIEEISVEPKKHIPLDDEVFEELENEISAELPQEIYAEEDTPIHHILDEDEALPSTKEKEYIFPLVESLEPNTDMISAEQETAEIEETMKMIEDTYESFNINMQVIDYSRGPTITRFEMEPPSGLKLRTILNLQDDLALQAGTSNIRIISPVEGRSCIGIEVPNKIRRHFLLREQIESVLFQESQAQLPLILGVDVAGKEVVGDLATTPHLLIAGTTGSGKSVYVNALIMGLLYKLSPEDLRFIMIDPKMVELEPYRGIPHLLAPIITKPEEAMVSLAWAVEEMDRRYKILSELGVRNIKEYKALAEKSPLNVYEKLPYIVIIVDEFANLMLRAPKDTEKNISRLASMSRAVGMHLVLATQRPSVDVVTGVIKANFPSRIAFRVSSKIDSRTILDKNGAETLLGRGDMLFMSPDFMDTMRIQSPFVSGEDVARIVNEIKQNGEPDYLVNFSEMLEKTEEKSASPDANALTDAVSDPFFEEVLRFAVENGDISASGVQRRFRVGYNRASRIIETMKDLKIISPPPSAGKGWIVNITPDEIEDYLQ